MAVGVAILGSTGSIGRSALAVLDRHRDRFRVVVLAAHRSAGELAEQAARFGPDQVVLVDPDSRADDPVRDGWASGYAALMDTVRRPDVDIVINAVVGAAGLEASLATLEAGKRLALANKESLVVAGPMMLERVTDSGAELVPVDSEHSAILQCLPRRGEAGPGKGFHPSADVRRLVLTASGGPFRDWEPEALERVTPAQALRHPTWDMGAKITVDSATLANKALEVIEAHYLFGVPYDGIDVVIHPQSIVHSFVEMVDGSVLAQLGPPSMELPILYALCHPERVVDTAIAFDPVASGPLTFEALDPDRFPAFRLGVEAGRAGGTAPAVYNAANEEAVAAFLAGSLPFTEIGGAIDYALTRWESTPILSLDSVLEADRAGRRSAREFIGKRC